MDVSCARCTGLWHFMQTKFSVWTGKFGEPTGVRTLDLLIKSQLLYQLSYRLPGGETSP